MGDELWEADWQLRASAPAFTITKQMAPGITPSQPAAAKQAYRPPGARGTQSTFKLHDDEEAPQNLKKTEPEVLSKSALKNKKRKEAAKAAKLAEAAIPAQKRAGDQAEALAAAANHAKEIKEQTYQGARGILADPQREKKARKLKEEAAGGKQLEKNQLEMISKEQELAEELKMLQLRSSNLVVLGLWRGLVSRGLFPMREFTALPF